MHPFTASYESAIWKSSLDRCTFNISLLFKNLILSTGLKTLIERVAMHHMVVINHNPQFPLCHSWSHRPYVCLINSKLSVLHWLVVISMLTITTTIKHIMVICMFMPKIWMLKSRYGPKPSSFTIVQWQNTLNSLTNKRGKRNKEYDMEHKQMQDYLDDKNCFTIEQKMEKLFDEQRTFEFP